MTPNMSFSSNRKSTMITKGIYVLNNAATSEDAALIPSVLIDQDETVLFGMGLNQDFFKLIPAIQSHSPIENLKYIIVPYVDTQFITTANLFASANILPTIVTSKRSLTFMNRERIKLPLYVLEDHNHELSLKSGRVLKFIPTPFMPTPGAFATYDAASKVMFSHMLFESVHHFAETMTDSEWLNEVQRLIQSHTPSGEFVKPVMKAVMALKPALAITVSGKTVNAAKIQLALNELSHFEFSNQFQNDSLIMGYYDYPLLIQNLISKLAKDFGNGAVIETFKDSAIELDSETMTLNTTKLTGTELWNVFFEIIYGKNGLKWLACIEKQVTDYILQYNLQKPTLYSSQLVETERKAEAIDIEKQSLKTQISALEQQLERTTDRLMKDPLTHAYNELFLREYLAEDIRSRQAEGYIRRNIALIYVNIDGILRLNTKYSKEIGDESIQNLGYLINQFKKENDLVFKRNAPGFIYYAYLETDSAKSIAEKIQNIVKDSNAFIEKITVSLSIVKLSEFSPSDAINDVVNGLLSTGENRIKLGTIKGTNVIIDEKTTIEKSIIGRLLVVDDEHINLSLLKSKFFNDNFEVITAKDGKEALEIAKSIQLDTIVCERNVPKLDGLSLKLAVNDISLNAKTPFILLTYTKNKETVLRANLLGIDAVIQKPILYEEILGMIQRFIKQKRVSG